MKDKNLTDIENKIKNDFAAGNFNIGDASDPNSIAGMAIAFLKGAANAAQESSKAYTPEIDLMTGIEALQALRNHYAVRRNCWERGLYVFQSYSGRPFGSYIEGISNTEDSTIMWRHEYKPEPSEPVEATHFLHDDWERVPLCIQDTMYSHDRLWLMDKLPFDQ